MKDGHIMGLQNKADSASQNVQILTNILSDSKMCSYEFLLCIHWVLIPKLQFY